MRVRRTYPNTAVKNVYRVDFRCHHNTRTEPKNSTASKNTHCPATMNVIVKRSNIKYSRSKDAHLSDFPMIVNIKFLHNHPINSADVLRFRDVSDEVKHKFEKLFEAGHSPASALHIHKMNIEMACENEEELLYIMADRAQVPDHSWCYRYYYTIFGNNYGKRDEDLPKVECNDASSIHEEVSSESEDVETADLPLGSEKHGFSEESIAAGKERLSNLVESLAESLGSDPESFLPAVNEFCKNFESLSTDSSKLSALMTFGKYSGLSGIFKNKLKRNRLAGLKRIGVQPTAVARRKHMPVGGRKCLTSGRPTKHAAKQGSAKRKTKIVSWALPKRRRAAPAPHSLSQCVNGNRNLGKSHSKS